MRSKSILFLLSFLFLISFFCTLQSYAQSFEVLNGATVTVQNSGTLDLGAVTTLAENGGSVTGNGQVKAVRTLNAPSGQDVAGLGAVITSGQNLGETTLIRSHAEQSVGNRKSVNRYYDISPTTNSGLGATLTFNYADTDLNNLPENDLTLFRSDDGGATYSAAGYDSRDASTNSITLSSIDSFARFSAAAPDLFNYGSLDFNGVDQYMDISTVAGDIAESSTLSVSFWVKPDFAGQTDGGGVVPFGLNDASGNDLFYIMIGAPGKQDKVVRIFDATGPIITGSALTGDTWHHIAFTYDNGKATIYVDGRNEGQAIFSMKPLSDDVWGVARRLDKGTPTNFLDGKVDEVRVWNTARSGQEIRNNVFQPLEGDETGLKAYWTLNYGTSGSSLNANDATLNNSPSFNTDTYPNGTFITGSEGWHMMSSAVREASYSTLLDTLWLQGISQGGDVTNGTANLYSWDEANYRFNVIDDATVTAPASEGFIFYVYNDQDYDGTPEGFPKMIRTDQQHRSGNVSPPMSFTDRAEPSEEGWNLTGNPYGATINWDASSGWTKINLDNAMYIWNAEAGEYQSWNGTSGTLDSEGLIAPWQGFWVKANAADPQLTLTDEVRSAGGIFRKEKSTPNIRFTLEDQNRKSQSVVMLSQEAQIGKDLLDAYKLESLNEDFLSLFTQLEDGSALDINALPSELENFVSIPMDIRRGESSSDQQSYDLSWDTKSLPEDWQFMLRDNETGEEINIANQSSVSFELSETTAKQSAEESEESATVEKQDLMYPRHSVMTPKVMKAKSYEGSRFTLTITFSQAVTNEQQTDLPQQVELDQNYPNPFNPTTTINYGVPEANEVTMEVFDMLGRKVATLINRENKQAGRHSVQFDAGRLASGLYLYRLKAGNTVITKKLTLIK